MRRIRLVKIGTWGRVRDAADALVGVAARRLTAALQAAVDRGELELP